MKKSGRRREVLEGETGKYAWVAARGVRPIFAVDWQGSGSREPVSVVLESVSIGG